MVCRDARPVPRHPRMGTGATTLDAASLADPHWFNGKLYISSRTQHLDDRVGYVYSLYLDLFRFAKFSESRLFRETQVARSLAMQLSMGLHEIMCMTRAEAHSDYHIHGYFRVVGAIRKYAAVCSVSSFVAKSCHYEVLSDERLAGRAGVLEETLESQLDFVQATTSLTWQRLAATVEDPEYSAVDVQHDSLHAAHVFAAFALRS